MALNGGGDQLETVSDPATWTLLEENTFIDIMAKEVKRGNRHSTTFSRSSWSAIEQEFYEKTNRRYNHTQLRNKYNQLRINYLWFTKLLKEPGFTWDPVRGIAIATDDVWESYLKTNKKARRFRTKGCPMYNELMIIFGDGTADYKDAYPLAQYPPSLINGMADLENESTNATPQAFRINSSGTDNDSQNVARKRCRSPISTRTHHLHRNTEEAKIVANDESPKETKRTIVSNNRSDPMNDRIQTYKNLEGCPETSSFSITNCVKCLELIEGVDAATYIKAIKMFKDVDWREMFMAMSAQRRLDWLASLE